MAKQRDFRNNLKKEGKQKIPLDSFKQHFYRQPALTEPYQFPEEYRKMEYDEESESSGDIINPMMQTNIETNKSNPELEKSKQTLIDEQKERQFNMRMEARSLDVYRVEDEVEDSFDTLKSYFNDFVLRLRSSNVDNENHIRKSSLFYQHEILQNEINVDGDLEDV